MEKGAGQASGVESLDDFFTRMPRFALAFSGGCDSAYLLAAAVYAGCYVKAYLVNTAFQPLFEREDALRVESALREALLSGDFAFEVIDADVLNERSVCANSPDRCYWCKKFIFETIAERMRKDGFTILVDGTNASDMPERRPGFRALAELDVVSPLRRAGLTKDQVRKASANLEQKLGLVEGSLMSDKPSFSCLATRVPVGTEITLDALSWAMRQSVG